MIRISAIYPNAPASFFDAAYYREKHEPFASSMLRDHGLAEIRTTIGVSGLDGSPPPFWAISEMVFASRAQFDDAMERCGELLFADIPNYTNASPVLQVSELGDDNHDQTGA
ncbi:MAG: hypothetical protein NVS3B5_09000 [Sphingomicrobium sp.]